jgi:hypothetical protein
MLTQVTSKETQWQEGVKGRKTEGQDCSPGWPQT